MKYANNQDIFKEANDKLNSKDTRLSYLQNLLARGRIESSEYVALNPTRNDKKLGSFRINLNTGKWSDFATDDKGGDLISLTAYIKSVEQYEAAYQILGIPPEQRQYYKSAKVIDISQPVVIPPTRDITDKDIEYQSRQIGCNYSNRYQYTDVKGTVVAWIYRWDIERNGVREKEIRPFSFDSSKQIWHCKFPDYRPLYNLPELVSRPDNPVIIVEGEKTAEAAKLLFPLYVTTTSMGGSKSVSKSDWSPLEGRDVILAKDYDEAGEEWLQAVANHCKKYNCNIQILPPERLGIYTAQNSQLVKREGEIPNKYDLADALADGWTSELIGLEANKDEPLFTSYDSSSIQIRKDEEEILDLGENRIYKISGGWLYLERLKKDEDKENYIRYWEKICGAIKVTHDIENNNDRSCSLLLQIATKRGTTKEIFIQNKDLADDKIIKSLLLEQGLHIEQLKQFGRGLLTSDIINHYINSIHKVKPPVRAIGVDKVGWHDNKVYVIPYADEPRKVFRVINSLGDNNQQSELPEYILQSNSANPRRLTVKGTLKEWQEHIGKYIVGNDNLIFAAAVALTAPFLTPFGEDGGCFHFSGSSSVGKTIALTVAGSIWGMDHGSLRVTDNAAESICKNTNDGLILMDELAESDSAGLEKLVYLLGNGIGKGRAKKNGEAQQITTFKILGLTTGEINLATKLAEKGKDATAGQGVRFIELPADTGSGYGIFNNIHHYKDSEEFARYFKEIAKKYSGTVMRQFLESITTEFDETKKLISETRERWFTNNVPPKADAQVKRVGRKFALIAAVGEMAILMNILPFSELSVYKSCKALFDKWVEKRGGTGSFEYKTIKSNLRKLIQQTDNRFLDTTSETDKVFGKKAGYKKLDGEKPQYWIFPAVFNDEVLEGRDVKIFCSQLESDGYLIRPQNDKHFTQKNRVPKQGSARFYVISAEKINDSEEV